MGGLTTPVSCLAAFIEHLRHSWSIQGPGDRQTRNCPAPCGSSSPHLTANPTVVPLGGGLLGQSMRPHPEPPVTFFCMLEVFFLRAMSSFYSFKNIFKKEEKMLVVLITENVLLEKPLPFVISARSEFPGWL